MYVLVHEVHEVRCMRCRGVGMGSCRSGLPGDMQCVGKLRDRTARRAPGLTASCLSRTACAQHRYRHLYDCVLPVACLTLWSLMPLLQRKHVGPAAEMMPPALLLNCRAIQPQKLKPRWGPDGALLVPGW